MERRKQVELVLEQMERSLHDLHSRHGFLIGFQTSLALATREKPFRIWSQSIWWMVLDHRDMLSIDLAAMARATCEDGGLLDRLRACAGPTFRRRRVRTPGESPTFANMLDALHSSTFARLFPQCARRFAGPKDFEGLTDRFFNLVQPFVADRSINRAPRVAGAATARMLALDEVEPFLRLAEELFNDLRLVALGDKVSFLADIGEHDAQVELVDMLLHGSLARASRLADGRTRDELYSALHRAHDQLPAGTAELFNEPKTSDEEHGRLGV